jgi:hypothetical protein
MGTGRWLEARALALRVRRIAQAEWVLVLVLRHRCSWHPEPASGAPAKHVLLPYRPLADNPTSREMPSW